LPRANNASPAWVQDLDQAVTRVSRAARSSRLHQLMGERARVDLGEHLHSTLAILGARQPVRVSELAGELDVERSTVSRRVSELVRQGFVKRRVDQADRRAAKLALTAVGERTLKRIQEAWHQTLVELTRSWRERERSETTSRLTRLADELESLISR
jgi:DNA-binding MarR family transcriptional regulator